MNKLVFVFLIGIFIFGVVGAVEVDKAVLKKIDKGEEKISVIVEEKNLIKTKALSKASDNNIREIARRGNKYIAFVTQEELEELKNDSDVLNVRQNIPLKIFLDESIGIIEANNSWNLQADGINLTGAGQSVCILDTGINTSHSDFSGRILAEKCYCSVSDSGNGGCCPDGTTEDDSAEDDDGHGTHVAGIVGASGGIDGVATDVGLVIVKIMNGTGDGNSYDLEDGLQWCIDNADTYNISIITASLGASSPKNSNCDSDVPTTTSIINEAFSDGISVTIATGNNLGNTGITWPSCISNATPVGAASKSDTLSYNRNSLLKILGIGVSVNSTAIDGTYETRSGTSMATPMVAGAIVIMNQFLNLTNQSKTPAQIEDVFYDTGKTISELGNNYSRINLYNAILSVDNIDPSVTMISPVNNKISLSENQTFICNASDWQLSNMTLKIWNSSGSIYYNTTSSLIGIRNESSFNVTNMGEGDYNWTCEIYDVAGNFKISNNYNLTIGGSGVALNSPSDNTYTNVNFSNFNCTSRTDSDFELDNVTFYLWNLSGFLIKNETKNISGFENVSLFNYTFENEMDYFWNCGVLNNNSDENFADENYSITYDTVAPLISDVSESVTSSSVTITWYTNENANSSVSLNENSSDFEINHSILVSGLNASTTYTYNITSCDRASNCNTSIRNSFTTSEAIVQTGGSGSSSSGVGLPREYIIEKFEINKTFSQKLRRNEKVVFEISHVNHKLTLINIESDNINISIESEPIYLTLFVGQEEKLNLTSPNYYNLLIKLEGIDGDFANISVMKIYEEIFKENISEKKDILVEETKELEDNEAPESNEVPEDVFLRLEDYWIILILIILMIILIILFLDWLIRGEKKIKYKTNYRYKKRHVIHRIKHKIKNRKHKHGKN